MLRKLREHATYANVMSTLGVFLALGSGVAIGAAKIGSNDIKPNAIKSNLIKNGEVKLADLAQDEAWNRVADGAFGNGGDGDCEWGNLPQPAAEVDAVSYYRDKLGVVRLTGLARSTDAPGGDQSCGGGAEVSDALIFTLPPAYRPENIIGFQTSDAVNGNFQFLIGSDEDQELSPGLEVRAGQVLYVGPGDPATVNLTGTEFRSAGRGIGPDTSPITPTRAARAFGLKAD